MAGRTWKLTERGLALTYLFAIHMVMPRTPEGNKFAIEIRDGKIAEFRTLA